jgi:hypothetical protein
MDEDEKAIEKLVLIKLLQLNATITGINLGLVLGFSIFLATNILLIKGGDIIGPHLALLGQFFIGYKMTFTGSLIGFLYGFGVGFLTGFVFAHLYNWLGNYRENKRNGMH